jgi:Uma2 family endonuclease
MTLSETEIDELIRDRAIRLLVLGSGKRIWEASPSPFHQMLIDDIRATIQSTEPASDGCGCYHISDVYVRFPDDSLVRPDIAIFCQPPPRQREALRMVPQAVIEVISPNYETKDTDDLPPVYLASGVQDVLVVDPDRQQVLHFHGSSVEARAMPITITLECGCHVTIPA